ncbi:MAG: discoidin domain-containing protein, partial [Phycisphaerae bacterium]
MMCPYCGDRNVQHPQQAYGRRDFLKAMAAASAMAAVADLATPRVAYGEGKYPSGRSALASMDIARVARLAPLGYQSKPASSDAVVKWVQVDLGQSRTIEQVKLFPVLAYFSYDAQCFPRRFRIEAADDVEFSVRKIIADHTKADYPSPEDKVAIFPGNGVSGRYVRLTATLLTDKQLALSKFEVWSGGQD